LQLWFTFPTSSLGFRMISRLSYRWVFRLWLTYFVSPFGLCINNPFDFDLLLPYHLSVTVSISFRLWLASSISPLSYRIDKSFDFDLLLLYHLSVTYEWVFRLWLESFASLSVVASVSLSALTSVFRITLGYRISKPYAWKPKGLV